MASPTYSVKGLVVRKTKLGETDVIVSLLVPDGRLMQGVAKGARKPSSQFAARLELFSEADVLMVQGKSLDIVKEARIVNSHLGVREGMERAAAAAPIAECVGKIAQPDLPSPKLYDCTSAALSVMDNAEPAGALAVSAAHLLKTFAFAGFRPSFVQCVSCGEVVDARLMDPRLDMVAVSAEDGGVLCDSCSRFSNATRVPAETLVWAQWLLMTPFATIAEKPCERRVSFDVLQLCQSWSRAHVGTRLKSIDFLLTSGVF